jgi:hypothetical protein
MSALLSRGASKRIAFTLRHVLENQQDVWLSPRLYIVLIASAYSGGGEFLFGIVKFDASVRAFRSQTMRIVTKRTRTDTYFIVPLLLFENRKERHSLLFIFSGIREARRALIVSKR